MSIWRPGILKGANALIDGVVKCPAASFPFNLRHCGVLSVRLIPQISGASHLNILLCHPNFDGLVKKF